MSIINDYRAMRRTLKASKEKLAVAKEAYKNSPSKENEEAMLEAKTIVILVIAVFVLAALIGPAVTALNATNTSGWSGAQIGLFTVIPIVIIAVIVMKITE